MNEQIRTVLAGVTVLLLGWIGYTTHTTALRVAELSTELHVTIAAHDARLASLERRRAH